MLPVQRLRQGWRASRCYKPGMIWDKVCATGHGLFSSKPGCFLATPQLKGSLASPAFKQRSDQVMLLLCVAASERPMSQHMLLCVANIHVNLVHEYTPEANTLLLLSKQACGMTDGSSLVCGCPTAGRWRVAGARRCCYTSPSHSRIPQLTCRHPK